jgi:hypothetical protein
MLFYRKENQIKRSAPLNFHGRSTHIASKLVRRLYLTIQHSNVLNRCTRPIICCLLIGFAILTFAKSPFIKTKVSGTYNDAHAISDLNVPDSSRRLTVLTFATHAATYLCDLLSSVKVLFQ